ncbi:unnamed protein product [Ambrosiozyma monospora]|uniref:Unnamed protein product n=1 Tax=Ambrosiozyma monospora TaxID=43982 RepID=A0A9W7DEW5_AMBMO|nr:unnamed protein product [Ambrosiozyma monospora]
MLQSSSARLLLASASNASRLLLPSLSRVALATPTRRYLHQAAATHNIDIGDHIPAGIPVFDKTPLEKIDMSKEIAGKKVLIVGVPGAFSPTCTEQTVHDYVSKLPYFMSRGFQQLIFVSVNDPYVMAAWRDSLGIPAHHANVVFLSDPKGKFVEQLGLTFDASDFMGNYRSKRFTLAVEDGMVVAKFVENDSTKCDITLPNRILDQLPGLD